MPDPLNIIEHDTSGDNNADKGNSGSTKIYKVWRTDDAVAVRALVAVTAPLTDEFGALRMNYDAKPKRGGVWEATVKYGYGQRVGSDNPRNEGGSGGSGSSGAKQTSLDQGIGQETTFDTTGGTQKITQSLVTMSRHKATADTRTIADTKQAIGVSEHGVEGTDVIVPKFAWTETWRFPATAITWAYVIRLRDMTGKVNTEKWRNFERGEVLYAGSTGSPDGPDWIKIAYTFHTEKNRAGPAGSPNHDEDDGGGIVIADGWDPIDKEGWDYLWVDYEPSVSGTTKTLVPRFAYVEGVYRRKSFLLLGLGN